MALFTKQELYCCVCGKKFMSDFNLYGGKVCSQACLQEYNFKYSCMITNKEYKPRFIYEDNTEENNKQIFKILIYKYEEMKKLYSHNYSGISDSRGEAIMLLSEQIVRDLRELRIILGLEDNKEVHKDKPLPNPSTDLYASYAIENFQLYKDGNKI